VSDGDATGLCGADRHIVELASDRTIALRLHVSFLASLFQHVGALIRKLRRGAIEVDAGYVVLARFAAACPPIEILRWSEYAARDAAELSGLQDVVRCRAEGWAADFASTMECMADDYRQGAWLRDRTALLETQQWLAAKLPPIKDQIILGMRRGLALSADDRLVDVVLVRQAYDVTGAHSHPVLVDTSRFAGADLIETLFHEIGHELLDRSVGLDRSGIAILNRALGMAAPPQVTVYDLLHVLLFAQVGSLVREHFDQTHRPLLYEGGRLARILQKMRVTVPQPDVMAVLNRHAAGHVELEEVAKFFIDHSAPPMPHERG